MIRCIKCKETITRANFWDHKHKDYEFIENNGSKPLQMLKKSNARHLAYEAAERSGKSKSGKNGYDQKHSNNRTSNKKKY